MIKLRKYVTIRICNDEILVISKNSGDLFIRYNKNDLEILSGLKGEGVDEATFRKLSFQNLINTSEFLSDIDEDNCNFRARSFFNYLNIPIDFSSILSKKILIFGAGGAGGTLVFLLAQQGFKNLIVIDDDIVNKSEIEKTMIYREDNLKTQKVYALKKIILQNFKIDITAIEKRIFNIKDIDLLLEKYNPSLVINAIDPDPIHKVNLNESCFSHKIPFLFMAYSFQNVIAGPFLVPGITSCYNSYYEYILNKTNNILDLRKITRFEPQNTIHPSISFVINLLCSIILKDILFYFSGAYKQITTLNNVLFFNCISLEGNILELNCSENCGICNMKNNGE